MRVKLTSFFNLWTIKYPTSKIIVGISLRNTECKNPDTLTLSMRKMFFLLLAIVLVVTTQTLKAATIISSFNFASAAGNEESYSADIINGDFLQEASITRGLGITPASGAGTFSSSGFTLAGPDASDYYSLTLIPKTGTALSLWDMSFGERRSSTGPLNWELRSSQNFSLTLASGTMPDDTNIRNHVISLSELSETTEPIEFRLYGFGAEGGTGTWRLDDIEFQAVPEPRGYGITVGIGLLAFVLYTYRRRKAPRKSPICV